MYMLRVGLGSREGGSHPLLHLFPGPVCHSHAAILGTATGPISFSCGHLTNCPTISCLRQVLGWWVVNRHLWTLSARKEELLLEFLKVASSYPLSASPSGL